MVCIVTMLPISPDPAIYLLCALYNRFHSGEHSLYIKHMEGFRLLTKWLAPPPPPPSIIIEKRAKWNYCYEVQEISYITGYDQQYIIDVLNSVAEKFD